MRISMPLNRFETIGNWDRAHSFRHEDDRKLLTNPKAVQKIKNQFSKTPFNFSFYLINKPGAGRHQEMGFTTPQWIEDNLGLLQGRDIIFDDDAINVVLTNNTGGDRMPMTGWILAHRLSHILMSGGLRYKPQAQGGNGGFPEYSQYTRQIMQALARLGDKAFGVGQRDTSGWLYPAAKDFSYPANSLNKFLHEIGRFKSATNRNLSQPYEFLHECFAQYLMFGRVKFNPFPKQILHKMNWGNPEHRGYRSGPKDPDTDWQTHSENTYQEYQEDLDGIEDSLNWMIEEVLQRAVGTILLW